MENCTRVDKPKGFIKGFKEDYLTRIDKNIAEEVNIPHNAVEMPYNYFSEEDYQGLFTYEKLFDVEKYDSNKVYLLHFEGFMFLADIYLNGEYLGKHYSGYLPVSIDISKVVKEKGNRLVVVLDSKENPDYPPFGFALDYLTFSGIYREVYLVQSRCVKRSPVVQSFRVQHFYIAE